MQTTGGVPESPRIEPGEVGEGARMRKRRVRTYRTYYQGQGPISGAFEVETPVARPTMLSDVAVPLCQGLVMGLTGGLLGTWGLLHAGLVGYWWPTWWVLSLSVFGLAFVVKIGSAESTLWQVERVLGADLDADGEVGQPEAHLVTLRQPSIPTPSPETELKGELVAFVRGCESDTSLRRWEPVLGRARYSVWRDSLIRLGWARWLGEDRRQGWELVRPASEVVEALL